MWWILYLCVIWHNQLRLKYLNINNKKCSFWFHRVSVYSYVHPVCSAQTYGERCSQTCGNCSNGETCNHVNGTCLHGCNEGAEGGECQKGKCVRSLTWLHDRQTHFYSKFMLVSYSCFMLICYFLYGTLLFMQSVPLAPYPCIRIKKNFLHSITCKYHLIDRHVLWISISPCKQIKKCIQVISLY